MSKFDIATEMNGIMDSPVYQSIFAKPEPQFTKMAAKTEDEKAKAEKEKAKAKAEKEKAAEKAAKEKAKEKAEKEKAKEKAEKEKAKEKADKEKAKAKAMKKKAMTKYEACIYSLCKASEILDEAGLGKASSLALLALDDLVKTAAKKKEEGKSKKDKKEDDKKAADKKKEEAKKNEDKAKKNEDKADAKGLPPWLKKKDEKKDDKAKGKEDKKDDKKKVKKASEEGDVECADCDTALVEDADDNKDFEDLMMELEEPEGEDSWDILSKPDDLDIDVDDPELTSLVEGIEDNAVTDESTPDDLVRHVASKKTSLQKLAEELASGILASK
jgi:hypothetical protein